MEESSSTAPLPMVVDPVAAAVEPLPRQEDGSSVEPVKATVYGVGFHATQKEFEKTLKKHNVIYKKAKKVPRLSYAQVTFDSEEHLRNGTEIITTLTGKGDEPMSVVRSCDVPRSAPRESKDDDDKRPKVRKDHALVGLMFC
ncbi:unnamed protein product [Choristocarpus tenellus]